MISTETSAQAWRRPRAARRGRVDFTMMYGIHAGAQYLPWVLDGAPEQARTAVLSILPPPAPALCRRVWEPKCRRSVHLG